MTLNPENALETGPQRADWAAPPRTAWGAWVGIVILSALIRFVDLDGRPAGLFRDEAEKGYSAFALATSGGVVEFPVGEPNAPQIRWRGSPLVIDVVGVKTSAIYQYASIPFVKIFGLTVGSTRMASALAGSLTVASLGVLLLFIWSWPQALAAMLWLAICPWHYLFSRWALQGIFVPLWMIPVLAGIAGAARERRWGWPLAGAGLGLMFYSYSGAEPFVLLWGAALVVMYREEIAREWKSAAIGAALMIALAFPELVNLSQGGGGARLGAIAIWTAEGATPLGIVTKFFLNYIAHFNPVFLFIRGDELPRHAIPGLGQMLLIDAFFLPIGLVASFRRRMPLAGALLAAFLCGPVGAAITRIGIPHALRSLPMVIPAAVGSGLGFVEAVRWVSQLGRPANGGGARFSFRGGILAGLIVLVSVAYAGRVFQIYWRHYASDPEVLQAFAYPERKAFEDVIKNRSEGERIWVSSQIAYAPYFILFYARLPPVEIAAKGLESQNFFIYDAARWPRESIQRAMSRGDWMISTDGAGGIAVEQKSGGA